MKFTDSHEWITPDGTVGITQFAQKELGEIVYVQLPAIGKKLEAGKEAAILESTKAAADIYAPASGTVIAVNEALRDQPQLLNQDPEKAGWLFRLELSHPSELDQLLDRESYAEL